MKKRIIENLILIAISILMFFVLIKFDEIYCNFIMNTELTDFTKSILIERSVN